jgi:hypothetical protein
MKDPNKKSVERAGRVYPALALAACLGLYLVAVSFRFEQVLRYVVNYLLP